MQNIRVKVYGFLRPCAQEGLDALRAALRLLGDEADEALALEGELLNVTYEGAFFPVEDFMAALAPLLQEASKGKLDYLDMEEWKITRYSFDNGFITQNVRDLNSVLDYSGH